MFVCRIFSFLSLCAAAVLAKPLQIVDESALSSSRSSLIDAAFVSNLSNSTPALDASGSFNLECDGALYGFYPNIADCENAAQSVVPDTEQLIWRERRTGSEDEYFPLPFAVFGGKW